MVAWIALSGVLIIIVYLIWDRRASWEAGEDFVRKVLKELRAEQRGEKSDAD